VQKAPILVMALALAVTASAQTPTKKLTSEQMRAMLEDISYWDAQLSRYDRIRARALKLRPERRNAPLRELNISDNEVREVQAIAAKFLPRQIVNISPVVTECPCEEGPMCTAQVYVLATTGTKMKGLQLSRMNANWIVGIVQQWWLRFDAVARRNTGNYFLDEYNYRKARSELYEEFPVCVGVLTPAKVTASTQKVDPKK
jgi:hypothetical protein